MIKKDIVKKWAEDNNVILGEITIAGFPDLVCFDLIDLTDKYGISNVLDRVRILPSKYCLHNRFTMMGFGFFDSMDELLSVKEAISNQT
jgi:hypothetical protein